MRSWLLLLRCWRPNSPRRRPWLNPLRPGADIMATRKISACVIPAYQPYSYKPAPGNGTASRPTWSGTSPRPARRPGLRGSNLKTIGAFLTFRAASASCSSPSMQRPSVPWPSISQGPVYTLGTYFVRARAGPHLATSGRISTTLECASATPSVTAPSSSCSVACAKSTQIQLEEIDELHPGAHLE